MFEAYTEQIVLCFMIDTVEFICNHRLCSITFLIVCIYPTPHPREIEMIDCDVEEGITWRLCIMVSPSQSYVIASISR